MMEQQTALKKNDEMQERWKSCVRVTCYAYEMLERVKEAIDNFYDALRQFINNIVESFKPVVNSLTQLCMEFVDFFKTEDFHTDIYTYPHSYPHIVHNFKIDTRGFPSPIFKCARSRC